MYAKLYTKLTLKYSGDCWRCVVSPGADPLVLAWLKSLAVLCITISYVNYDKSTPRLTARDSSHCNFYGTSQCCLDRQCFVHFMRSEMMKDTFWNLLTFTFKSFQDYRISISRNAHTYLCSTSIQVLNPLMWWCINGHST